MKTFLRAPGLQMSHALYIPTCLNDAYLNEKTNSLSENGLPEHTILLLRLNSVRLSSFTGVIALKFDVSGRCSGRCCTARSDRWLVYHWHCSVGQFSDVSSQACTDNDDEQADTAARCLIRDASQPEETVVAVTLVFGVEKSEF